MKPIFARGIPLQVRLILAVIFSLLLLIARHQVEPSRQVLSSLLSPLQCLSAVPSRFAQWVGGHFASKSFLEQQNHELLYQQLMMSERLQKFEHIHQENIRLRNLLGSQIRLDARKVVTEVMAVASDPYHHYIVLRVGELDGVYEGQTVIDGKGIIGQVTQVGALTSRVLLISDVQHAIPVRIARSDVRSIAYGTGEINEIELKHLPISTDVQEGDLVVSSGLGGRFPEGYPVARINKVERDPNHRYAIVSAEPIAALDRVRYVLLLWPGASPVSISQQATTTTTPEEPKAP
jgi:rod shape-determining protein MreC